MMGTTDLATVEKLAASPVPNRFAELLELGAAGIHVAEYLTVLPPQEFLRGKLQDANAAARLRFNPKDAE
jgi:hypothetical protein